MFVVFRKTFNQFVSRIVTPFLFKTKRNNVYPEQRKKITTCIRAVLRVLPVLSECSRCFSKKGISKLRQKPFVILIKAASVLNAVQKHCQAFDAEPERKALPIVVNAAIFKDIRVYHPATPNFEPGIMKLPEICNKNIDFEARFREREKARSQTYFEIFAEKLTHKVVQSSL